MGRAKKGGETPSRNEGGYGAGIKDGDSNEPLESESPNMSKPRKGAKPWIPLKELSEKHLYFAKRLALNDNAAKAARESGFDSWYGSACLTKDPLIRKEVDKIRKARRKRFELSENRVLEELCRVAFSNLSDFLRIEHDGKPVINCEDVGRDEMAALAQIEQEIYIERTGEIDEDGDEETTPVKKTKIKMYDKLRALESLARTLKMFDSDGPDGQTPEEKANMIVEHLRKMKAADGV